MKCTYKIKKPDGGVIIIPADFGLISKNKRVKEAYEAAIETNNTTELVNTLTELSGKTMDSSQVYNIVSDNLQDLDIIIDEMNESIPQNAEYNNFEKALYKYLSSNDVDLVGIEESLKQPIKLDYLDDVNPIGLLDQTSLQKEHNKVKTEISFSRETGLPSEIMVEMDKFFSAIERKDGDTYNSNNLLANHSVLGARSANVGNYTVYSKGSYDSLFLGVFKRLGNSLDKNIVKAELGSETYFSTTSNAAGVVQHSLFEEDLLSKNAKNKNQITKAIKLVTEYLGGNTDALLDSITNLFAYLSPEIFINEQLLRTKRVEQTAVNDRESNEEFQLKSSEDYLSINKEDLGVHYAPAKRASYDLLNFLSSTITLGQDLVQIPLSETNKPYILVTEISGTDGMVRVSGIQNIEGQSRFVDYVFKGKQDVFYRIKENPIQEAVLGETIDTTAEKTHSSSNNGFKPDVLKALLRKGDVVNISIAGVKTTNKTVVGVYPGHLVVDTNLNPAEINQSEDTLMIVPYNKVKHIYSAELKTRHDAALNMNLSDLNGYSKVTDMSLLSEGDIIVDPTSSKGMFKVVLAADNSNVYTYYMGTEGKPGKIQRLSKKGSQTQLGIETAWSYAFNQITGAEASALVANFENNGTKEATMSSFTDPNGAKTNDFFISSEVSGKILDAKSGKSVIVAERGNEKTTRIVNFRDYEGLMFFTNKDVVSKYDMSILRVNNWRIFTDKSSLHNPKEVVYVIPKGYDKNKVYLFSNNYGNVGQYKDAEFVDSKRDQVITDHMISLIESRDGTKIEGGKLYVNKIGPNSNVYHRDTVGLEQAFYFSTLDEGVKKELDVLKPGVYFKVAKENTLDYNFYRIMKVDGDKVTARINKISVTGDLLSFEKVFSAKELLATKGVNDSKSPVNSIYALFLQYGNKNMPLIKRAYDEKMSATQVESAKSIETVKYAMTQTFKGLGIEVTEGVEGFADTQKAKIETTIQENGEHKVTIVLNNKNGDYTDLIHENIHIYLTLLRHTSEQAYYDLIETIINQDSRFQDKHGLEADLSTKEEFVVNDLIRLTEGENNFLYKNLKNFMLSVNEVIKNTINPDYEYDISKIVNNPVNFLKTTTMRSLYGIDMEDNSHPFYNMGMLATETFMREWMIENNIKLKCD